MNTIYRQNRSLTSWAPDPVRARVAQCAPEALKMLVGLEKSVRGIEGCVECEGWKQHRSNCALVALLKKAGITP